MRIGSLAISPFLFAILGGALIIHYRFLRRLPRVGLDPVLGARMSVVVTVCSLLGAHFFDAVYEPLTEWWNPWNGLSALGGLIGFSAGWAVFAAIGSVSLSMAVAMFDAAVYCAVLGCAVMRLGCFAVHDHVGAPSTHWLAVNFPDGARWDLGLLEALFWFALAVAFRWFDRARHAAGFYPAICLIAYPAFRLLVDPLRVDQTYRLGISVDAWVALAAIPTGCWFAWYAHRTRELVAGAARQP